MGAWEKTVERHRDGAVPTCWRYTAGVYRMPARALRTYEREHTLQEWWDLCEQHGNRCVRCGAADETLTRDHVVPLSMGGADSIDNIQPLCGPCNSAKGVRVIDFRDGGAMEAVAQMKYDDGPARKLTVTEAAQALGISSGAVRNRLSRGTLRSVRENDTVYVLLPSQLYPERDAGRDTTDMPGGMPPSDAGALISEMRDRIASLEHQLEQERQANSEHRRLLAAALERIPPQLEAPESPESPAPSPPPTEPPEEALEGVQRPWWRRMFGG